MARDWMATYLNAAGFPDTAKNRRLLSVWQRYEGGHTKNSARFNYLNTTQNMPGSRSINSVGVKAYGSLQQGAQAWAKTLKNGRYGDLYQGFKSGDPYKANVVKGLSTWLSGSPDSAAGHTYAQKVLGESGGAPAPTPGAPAPQQPQVDLGLPTPKQSAQAFGQIAAGAKPTDIFAQFTKAHFGGNRSTPRVPIAPGVDAQIQGNATDNDIAAIKLAQHYIGTPYSWGGGGAGGPSKGIGRGANTVGFDCSGLIEFVWAKQGIQVGGTTYTQIAHGQAIRPNAKNLRPGDAVFFGDPKSPHHVGLYIGGGKFIESPHTGATVRISKLAGRHPSAARRYG